MPVDNFLSDPVASKSPDVCVTCSEEIYEYCEFQHVYGNETFTSLKMRLCVRCASVLRDLRGYLGVKLT